jgi:IS30 family transposase
MSYKQLVEGQRYQIQAYLSQNLSQNRIAELLEVNPSTISRELKRNTVDGQYCPKEAQRRTNSRREAAVKFQISDQTKLYVHMFLEADWSPEQISAVLNTLGFPVSHEWIYQYVAKDKSLGGVLFKHLRQGKRKYRKGKHHNRLPIADARSIELRPPEVDERNRLGDWEADTVLGKHGSGAIVTLAERKSRLYLVRRVDSKSADDVTEAIIKMLSPHKEFVKTITFDNGGEFAQHKKIEQELQALTYFAHPYSSWERGLNENFNGLLRQYIPKGADLRLVTNDDLAIIEKKLNLRPRKCLGFRQPQAVYEDLKAAA